MSNMVQADAALHLAGDQVLSTYVSLRQCHCETHIIAVTGKTRFVGETIKSIAPAGTDVQLLDVPEYDLPGAVRAIQGVVSARQGAKWIFNLTGGTKPVFAAAYHVAAGLACPAYFVETNNKTLDWLLTRQDTGQLNPVFESIDDFVRLARQEADRIPAGQHAERASARKPLVELCWKERELLSPSYRIISTYTKNEGVYFTYGELVAKGNVGMAAQLKEPPEYRGTLRIGHRTFQSSPWKDLASFIVGGWFEEAVFLGMKALQDKGRIKDLAIGLIPASGGKIDPFHRFDVSYTDGHSLTIMQCRVGEVKPEHVQRLESMTSRFAGQWGRGILVCAEPKRVDERLRQRMRNSTLIGAVSGARLLNGGPACVMGIAPGHVLL